MFVCGRFGQNQGLWSQNGDTMSLGLDGVFQLMKKEALPSIAGENRTTDGSLVMHHTVYAQHAAIGSKSNVQWFRM